jgi:hypothetical protein
VTKDADKGRKKDAQWSIEDTTRARRRVAVDNGMAANNPYDQLFAIEKKAARKPTDLRKLSEWIKTKRSAEDLKRAEAKASAPAPAAGKDTKKR